MIRIKRTYEPRARGDGRRILVERLWPRGMKKEDLHADAWMKDVAPSTELRQWFGHEVERWDEFRRRYQRELTAKPDVWGVVRRRRSEKCRSHRSGRDGILHLFSTGALMTAKFKVGDRVTWNSEAGHVSGTIIKVHTRDVNYKGYTHHASEDDPQYEIQSSKTDHIALHKGSALAKQHD
jgi:uncharacterized protein YeaO (DUF488 family)